MWLYYQLKPQPFLTLYPSKLLSFFQISDLLTDEAAWDNGENAEG